ncbi:hypothetical protein WA026_015195 [Henosepilachna vigintioctopunctata]
MKSSLEAAGAGAINFGPSGILGNLAGQFGVKINKEQTTSGNTAKLVSKRSISKLHPTKRDMMAKLEKTKLAAKSMKNCFGFPQIKFLRKKNSITNIHINKFVAVINIVVTQPPSTTTGGTPDVRGASTTAST